MKRLLYFFTVLLFTILWYGCTREGRIDHIDSQAPAPAQISDVKVDATPGGGIITYKIPTDPNFSYGKAIYEIQPGIFREAMASSYKDSLVLVGFGDTLSHEVKLYSVGKNGKKSEPISINITPLTPPVLTVFKTLTINATFGGVQVSFKNISQGNMAIIVMADTTGQNTWSTLETFYTGALEGKFSVRGLDTTNMKFALFLRDRWGNKSDTLIKSLSPFFEEFIPKNTWSCLPLPTDSWQNPQWFVIQNLWDDNLDGFNSIFASLNESVLPQWFTIDLGVKVTISRISEHTMEGGSHCYNGSAVKKAELWGSNDPDNDGGWTHWNLLGTFNSFKPSGLPLGQTTAEDVNYAHFLGENFGLDIIPPVYRFIRFKTLETYGMSGQVVLQELDLYGQIER